jgi:CRISPR-associated protein Csb1
MSNILEQFDHYLKADGPAAIVTREPLIPVEGADGVFFPPTFAASKDKTFEGGYNIDGDPNGKNVALIDSVGSQANRIEPIFAEPEQAALVPQVVITAGTKKINLLEAGHRAGDAIVRCSSLQQELQDAFKALLDGNAARLAKIAPTSLVFGVWDSRDTQAKMPRLIASTIRAYDVQKLTRSAQYWAGASPHPETVYEHEDILGPAKDDKDREQRSSIGLNHQPATGSHGGIIAKGGIRRDATLAIAALKLINAGSDSEATLKLRRYILGLALVAFTKMPGGYLRQGTILVSDPDKERKTDEVYANGSRKPFTVTHEEALKYAKAAAEAFGVGKSREVPFDAEKAKTDLDKAKAKKEKK